MSGCLGGSLTVRGQLRGSGDVSIEGSFEGEITLEGALTVAGTGSVVGLVRATDVEVLGEVDGPVAGQQVTLRASARVHGDVRALSLTIDDGAVLDGLIEMGDPGGGR